MKFSKIAAALTLATISTGALAGGPLYIHEPTMQPYKWDTSKGSIPVWTDGGQLIKDKDGNTVMTVAYHLKRGYCCGSGCRHCPFKSKDQKQKQ